MSPLQIFNINWANLRKRNDAPAVSIDEIRFYFFSCFIYCCLFGIGAILLKKIKFKYSCYEKALSWLLSGITGFIMSIIGIISIFYLYIILNNNYSLYNIYKCIHSDPQLSRLTCIVFVSHCHMDILLGLKYYNKYIDILSGYIHHIIYTIIIYYALYYRCCLIFSLFALEEIPTVLLSIGNIHKPYRQDLVFGIIFLLLRIIYHIFICILVYISNPIIKYELYILIFGTLTMHIHWWTNWLTKYIKNKKYKINDNISSKKI
eukprot:GHVL01012282.1.p1 GENE.GHVL01012282.1~~GHVL01012282.1.p1  ORF type:complete len:292 (+),score=71.24 GHVL01012282.1:92-877(+)